MKGVWLVKWSVIIAAISYLLLYWRVYENAEDFSMRERVVIVMSDVVELLFRPFDTSTYEEVLKAKVMINTLLGYLTHLNPDPYSSSLFKTIDFFLPLSPSSSSSSLHSSLRSALSPSAPSHSLIAGEGIRVRYYEPKGREENTAGIVFIHGGGWVLGNIDTYDLFCRSLAVKSSFPVFSIEYRTAPENKFPAAVDDCYAASLWIKENAAMFSINSEKLAVMGDSAGGNIAAVVSVEAGRRREKVYAYQYLIYPVTDYFNLTRPSYAEWGPKAYYLSDKMMVWFFNNYLNDPLEASDWRVSPLRADLSSLSLPPASIALATFDPLYSEGLAYSLKLQLEAKVEVKVREYRTFHGFMNEVDNLEESQALSSHIASDLHLFFSSY